MQRKRGAFSLFILLLSIWLILLHLGARKASLPELTLASLIYFICCLPTLLYFLRSEQNIPYLPLFGVFYFIYYGFSIFNNYSLFIDSNIATEAIIKSLYFSLAGFLSLLVAFYSPLGKVVETIVVPLKIAWDPSKAYRLGRLLGFLGVTVYYLSFAGVEVIFSGLIGFIISLSHLGIAILFLLQLQGKLKFEGKAILWFGLFIPRVFLDLVSGATLQVIIDFVLLFLIYFYYHKSIPWLRIIMAILIYFVVFSARDEYRQLAWYGEYAGATPLKKCSLYVELIYKKLTGEKEQHKVTYEQLSLRTDYLATFSKVVELTPAYIPFWGGYTYSTLWTSLIPRFIMPGKPHKLLGSEFGHRYMFLDPYDRVTSYNLPMFVEFYINFGQWGVIIGMFILGLVFRIFYKLFNHPGVGEGGCIISTVIFISLLNLEGDFSLTFGNTLQHIILFYIILKRMKLSIERMQKEK